MNMFEFVPLTFILDFKSENLWDQLDHFKAIMKAIDVNGTDIQLVNKKLKSIQTLSDRKASHVQKNTYKLTDCSFDSKNIWLLKPTGLNRGRGIHIFKSYEEFLKLLKDHYDIYIY
mmetsp:Transcript_14249/g.13818  ORF Transcript_14249/g.13818 Transcript_14249/m.13818 type:complete len:116 (-) Transcript_14249:779-1126(-)